MWLSRSSGSCSTRRPRPSAIRQQRPHAKAETSGPPQSLDRCEEQAELPIQDAVQPLKRFFTC